MELFDALKFGEKVSGNILLFQYFECFKSNLISKLINLTICICLSDNFNETGTQYFHLAVDPVIRCTEMSRLFRRTHENVW